MPGSNQLRYAGLHDLELCAQATVGDRAAFGELARRHGSTVRALLRRMGAPAPQADDVAQDAFLIAFERIVEFRGEGTFVAWLKRIAARAYLRRLQKEKRLAALANDAAADGEEAAVDVDRRLDLDEAMTTLSPVERLCVSMCFGAGLSHAEAATALKLPLGTVKSHVRRGLDKLRARLAVGEPQKGRQGHG